MAEQEQPLVTVTIDGTPVRVPKGTLLVEAAKQIRREIPVYCYHTKMGPAGLCRICLVEVEGMPKLQIGCNTPVADGMVVHTQSEKAADGRRAVLELYLVNHPLDCPICDKGGECDLQDYAMAYGQGASDVADQKVPKPKAIDLGPTIVLDEERCVVCQRCIRFDDIIVGERKLVMKDRGHKDIIATATGEPYRHNYTGNVTELCPVGALTSKTYRFKARPWDLKRTATSCTQCSTGCQMFVDTRGGTVVRSMSVESDDAISDTWICDRGRYNIGFYEHPERLTQPLYKNGGEWVQIGWDDALAMWAEALQEAGAHAGVIGGGRMTNEEAFLAQHLFRAIGIRNIDWRAGRQRQATPGSNGGTLVELERADAILILGESPAERAPIMDLRIRRAARHNGAVIVRIGSLERSYPSIVPHADVATIDDALTHIPQSARTIALVWDGVDTALGKQLVDAMPASATVRTYITGEQPNARGAEAMGMHPAFAPGYAATESGSDTAAMLRDAAEGKLRTLAILGANPMLHYSGAEIVRSALAKTPFVVVSDLFMTETAELATLVLPARGPFEKTGTTTNLAGDVLPVNAAVDLATPDGTLSDLEMLVGLAQELRVALPTAEELDASILLHLAQAPEAFTFGDERFGAPVVREPAAAQSGSLRVAYETRIFAGGGTVAHDERIDGLRPLPQAAVAPSLAASLNLQTGDYVDLATTGEKAVTIHDLLVEVRDHLPDGVVVLIDGLADDPANRFDPDAVATVVNVRRARVLAEAAP